jgi:hypothetical protein
MVPGNAKTTFTTSMMEWLIRLSVVAANALLAVNLPALGAIALSAAEKVHRTMINP